MKKTIPQKIKRIMIIVLSVLAAISIIAFLFMQQASFGKQPSGNRKQRILESPNYRDGSFQNINKTATFGPNSGAANMMWESMTAKKVRLSPTDSIPSVKRDLLNLDPSENVVVWFGHSSYFMQIDGKTILVDPVLSKSAAPVSFVVKAFDGAKGYTADDMPNIDYLFITHDHWDHLDYNVVTKLKPKVGKVITGLGVGEHLEYWGYDTDRILEGDWGDSVVLDKGFVAHYTPARHFSGRSLNRNQSLWTSFVLQTPTMNIFMGGDSGYDTHFAQIGETFGHIDIAFLENGQYDHKWPYVHMHPQETLQAAKDLNTKYLFPVHSSKFVLANHPWDEPLIRLSALSQADGMPLITPIVGEIVNLQDTTQRFARWWGTIN